VLLLPGLGRMELCAAEELVSVPALVWRNCFQSSRQQNRMFQLERTYDNHLVQLSDHFRADPKVKARCEGHCPNAS